MRLIHTTTLSLREFNEADIPPYAILSHRWEKDEVSFQDMSRDDVETKAGYQKIKNFCRTAAEDGFEYVWVDTCCIDKTNSSELSEAINSMYRWYKDSEVCYAYLSDVDSSEDPHAPTSSFLKSKWFTRGWTLQELIAPSVVMFYGSDWKELGTNSSLRKVIQSVTGIHVSAFLGDHADLRKFSIAQKMSWAAKRRTTRTEDIAYCLMGLFDINMPMLYGEGEGAFIRLQEEIMRKSDDPTIFAWTSRDYLENDHSLLARSPLYFRSSGNIVRSYGLNKTSFTLTNRGVHIQLPMFKYREEENMFVGLLSCHNENRGYSIGIVLGAYRGSSEYGYRQTGHRLEFLGTSEIPPVELKSMYVKPILRISSLVGLFDSYQYRIRGANIQDQYPPGFVQSDGIIKDVPQRREMTCAIKVAVDGRTKVILLRVGHRDLSASVATHPEGMSLKEIVQSCNPKKGVWITKPDRIVQEISPGRRWFISLRKQIVSGERTLTLEIST